MKALGRMRHALRSKCVDACRASRVLAGDYSPRTGAIVPKRCVVGKPNSAPCAVDTEAIGISQSTAGAEMTLDQRRVFKEAVGHQAQLAVFH